ncbi:anti-sigma factor RsbA family regulatory protein [Modestobacter versicolor]|uniref:anti-sigma factor RsbA family regulatory protein n=1 Tax=Modestobacter versicolor TaxID=429133 RepID=UPI0034DEE35A
MPATGADQHPERPLGYLHDLVLDDSPEELAAHAESFLRAGLAAGDGAVVAAGPRIGPLLREALADDDRVLVLDPATVYRGRTPAAITALRQLAEQHTPAGRRLRVVGETVFGPTPRDWLEWERYEAVINEALRHHPLWGLCVYDTSRLPDEVVATGLATHPYLVTAAGRQANPGYSDPADVLRALPVPDEPLERTEPLLRVDDVADFIGLRHTVGDRLADLGGSPELAEDLHLAIDEMSSNALRHGSRPVQLLLWGSAERVVCRIRDHGPGMDAPFAGYGPAHGADLSRGGMGLWLARQLCDHVDILDEGDGLTVRLVTSLR